MILQLMMGCIKLAPKILTDKGDLILYIESLWHKLHRKNFNCIGNSMSTQGIKWLLIPLVHFLAHLSRRLIGELIVYLYSGVRRPSVGMHYFKHLLRRHLVTPPTISSEKCINIMVGFQMQKNEFYAIIDVLLTFKVLSHNYCRKCPRSSGTEFCRI